MDIQAATMHALTVAQTERQALDLLIEQRPELTIWQAREALGKAVSEVGWTLLVAPELWLVLEEHFTTQRLANDLEVLREARDALAQAIQDPTVLEVVEVAKEDQPLRLAGTDIVRTIKVGPDVLSARTTALSKLSAEITRAEQALSRSRETLQKHVYAYQARVADVASMGLREQAAEILRMALLSGRLELAHELAKVANGGAPKVDATFWGSFAEKARGLIERRK